MLNRFSLIVKSNLNNSFTGHSYPVGQNLSVGIIGSFRAKFAANQRVADRQDTQEGVAADVSRRCSPSQTQRVRGLTSGGDEFLVVERGFWLAKRA